MSLDLLRQYADRAVDMADQVPDSDRFGDDLVRIDELQRSLGATPATWSVLIRWGLRHASTSTRSTR